MSQPPEYPAPRPRRQSESARLSPAARLRRPAPGTRLRRAPCPHPATAAAARPRRRRLRRAPRRHPVMARRRGYGAPPPVPPQHGYPPQPGYGGQPAPRFSVGDAFSWSWNKFTSNASALIVPVPGLRRDHRDSERSHPAPARGPRSRNEQHVHRQQRTDLWNHQRDARLRLGHRHGRRLDPDLSGSCRHACGTAFRLPRHRRRQAGHHRIVLQAPKSARGDTHRVAGRRGHLGRPVPVRHPRHHLRLPRTVRDPIRGGPVPVRPSAR